MYSHFQDLEELPLTHQWYQMQTIEDKDERKAFWPWWSKMKFPRFSPLPFNRVSRQFIRIDKKTLKEWHINEIPNKWWISTLLDIYKRAHKGRIHPFADWRFLDSPETTRQHFNADNFNAYDRPKLPGKSFMTDGVAVHITMVTLTSPHDNFDGIIKRGYTGIVPPEHQIEFADAVQRTGVHKLESIQISDLQEPLNNVEGIGCDPGKNKPVAWARFNMNNWLPNTPPQEVAQQCMNDAGYYTKDELLRATKRTKFKDLEDQRTAQIEAYRETKARLSVTIRRTYNLGEMEEYAKARVLSNDALVAELLNVHRSYQRRIRFRHIQRNITNIVHKIIGEPSRKRRHWTKKYGPGKYQPPRRCIFFGRALFSGTRGCVSVPRKAIIRALGCRFLVLLVNEFNTSKLCPIDYYILTDIINDENEDRLRQCPTAHHGENFTCDRDIIGATNILQKSIYEMCGRRIAAFYPQENDDN